MNFRTMLSKTRIVLISATVLLAAYGFTSRVEKGEKTGTAIGEKAPELAFYN